MKNMKKRLNSKGFTLIELLAVIVILALIMVIAIPNVLESMNSSRVSSLHSKAKSVVSWYSDTILSESLANTADSSKKIQSSDISTISAGKWVCIGELSSNFQSAVDLPVAEYVLTRTSTVDENSDKPDADGQVSSATTCSAIRSVGGKVEVVLVATQTGKFNVPGKTVTYAYSGDTTGKTK